MGAVTGAGWTLSGAPATVGRCGAIDISLLAIEVLDAHPDRASARPVPTLSAPIAAPRDRTMSKR